MAFHGEEIFLLYKSVKIHRYNKYYTKNEGKSSCCNVMVFVHMSIVKIPCTSGPVSKCYPDRFSCLPETLIPYVN